MPVGDPEVVLSVSTEVRARELPRDDSSCGWVATLPPPAPARRLLGAERADCAVIGAGFTGLAVARRLALHRPQWRIVILEAQRVGLGASGRNSGFVVDVGHHDPGHGIERSRRFTRLGRAGLAELRLLVEEHSIACQWAERGRLHGAVGPIGVGALENLLQGLRSMNEPHEVLDGKAIAAITGSTRYLAGARTPGGATMQPAALVRGLAVSLPAAVEVYEESPVRAVGHGPPFTLDAAVGSVIADRVFLATNGYTPSLGFLSRHLFPLHTFGSLTRPLGTAEQAALGGEREWGLVCEERLGATVRRTADQRILIRNTVRYSGGVVASDAFLQRVRERHVRSFRERFPMLEQVTFESTWGGVLGISMNGVPFFGEIHPGLYAAAGYNGVGVALGTVAGSLLADLALGATSDLLDDMRSLATPARIPRVPLLGLGIRATLAYRDRRAREEL